MLTLSAEYYAAAAVFHDQIVQCLGVELVLHKLKVRYTG